MIRKIGVFHFNLFTMLCLITVALFLMIAMTAESAHQVSFVSEIKLRNPVYVAVGADGNIYFTGRQESLLSSMGYIDIYNQEGQKIGTIVGKNEEGDPYLKKPAGIAVYNDKIYVCDASRDKIFIFSKTGAYLDEFGENGSQPKEFKNPEAIFVYRGIIYVADTDNDRIQVFGPNGVYLRSLGNGATAEAKLKKPTAVAVDDRGFVYAVDGEARRIKIYRQDGAYKGSLAGLNKPYALAIADDGLLVTDVEKSHIVKFKYNGEKIFSIGSEGEGKIQFQQLSGIAADNQGKIYAVDRTRGSVQIIATGQQSEQKEEFPVPQLTAVQWNYDISGNVQKLFWDKAQSRLMAVDGENGRLLFFKEKILEKDLKIENVFPLSLSMDSKGFLWVFDKKENSLLKLDAEGRVKLKVGSSGSKEGYFSGSRDFLIGADDMIYVADTGNNRLQVFNTEGVLINVFTKALGNEMMQRPIALSQDKKGNLYVLCEERKVVVCIDAKGKALREIDGKGFTERGFELPISLAVNNKELMVLDAGVSSIKVFSLDGKPLREFGAKGSGKGDFKKPVSIVVSADDQLMVSDSGNGRIQSLSTLYAPAVPTGVTAKPGMRFVDLVWDPSDEFYIADYRILRLSGGEADYREIGILKKPPYRDTDVQPGMKYLYRVCAKSIAGIENYSMPTDSVEPLKYVPPSPVGLAAKSQEWSVDLFWRMEKTDFVDYYKVYRETEGDALLAKTKEMTFTETGLESDTSYNYLVSAVSIDGRESDPATLNVRTIVASKPPLEIDIVEINDVFSNTYKIYENEGIGQVKLTNNMRDPIVALKLSFFIKEYMDFPTQVEVRDLLPKENRNISFNAVFNNRVLDVTEDTPVQAEIKVVYYENQKTKTFSTTQTLKLYEKHRMMWVNKDRVATFVTSKDPVLVEFARAVVTQYADIGSPLIYGAALYETLGKMGMTYLQHPTNPYQIVEGKTHFVDYVQYPRETLKRNSGVCTDLVVLYTAALESIGIRTMILGTPDHLFMMFAVGQVSDLGDSTVNNMFVVLDGIIWAPVELTLVGSDFIKAWEVGSRDYYEWNDKGIEMTDLTKAWERYKPASLPFSDWRAKVPPRSDVEKHYADAIGRLYKIWLKYTCDRYYAALAKNPNDADAYLQLGIIYGQAGEIDKAMSFFEKVEKLSPSRADIKNNIANLQYLKGQYDLAGKYYEKASELDPADPCILVNLSKSYMKMNKKEKASQIFQKAVEIDPEIARKHRTLALELLGNM